MSEEKKQLFLNQINNHTINNITQSDIHDLTDHLYKKIRKHAQFFKGKKGKQYIQNMKNIDLKTKIKQNIKSFVDYFDTEHMPNSDDIVFEETTKNIMSPHYKNNTFVYNPKQYIFAPVMQNTILLHETVPGHHYMIQRVKDTNGKFDLSFVEGWAFYSESLFDKNCIDDKISYNCSQLIRAIRTYCDIMYNYYNEPISYISKIYMLFFPIGDSKDHDHEIERIKNHPSTLTCYVLGEKMFFDIRDQYLKNKNKTIKDFHRDILSNGIQSKTQLQYLLK